MESLIPAFYRVLRGLADAQALITIANDLSRGSKEALSLSSSDRLGILDFPDPEQQQENIATATVLSKPDLLKRAAEAPRDLTALELNILKQRYWLDETDAEWKAQSVADDELLAVSEDYWTESKEQLKRVRSAFYDIHEEQALLNAEPEEIRRQVEAIDQRKQEEVARVEANLHRVQPWVKRFWDEGRAKTPSGFAAFYHPNVGDDEFELDEFESRKDAALWKAKTAVGFSERLGDRWRIRELDWPDDGHDGEGEEDENSDTESPAAVQEDHSAEEQTADEAEDFHSDLSKLRARFRALRDDASNKKRKTGSQSSRSHIDLEDGVLHNIFLLFTRPCVDAVLAGYVDNMWVWAIDPDYEDPSPDRDVATEYKGYLRVRLQQLVNNFFDARLFHEDEHSMEQLWQAAQRSHNQAFVSLKDDEVEDYTMSRDVGTSLRMPGSKESSLVPILRAKGDSKQSVLKIQTLKKIS